MISPSRCVMPAIIDDQVVRSGKAFLRGVGYCFGSPQQADAIRDEFRSKIPSELWKFVFTEGAVLYLMQNEPQVIGIVATANNLLGRLRAKPDAKCLRCLDQGVIGELVEEGGEMCLLEKPCPACRDLSPAELHGGEDVDPT